VRAEALGPTIHRLRKVGFSVEAIARESALAETADAVALTPGSQRVN